MTTPPKMDESPKILVNLLVVLVLVGGACADDEAEMGPDDAEEEVLREIRAQVPTIRFHRTELSATFTEERLRLDATNYPNGLFTSDDSEARDELIALRTSGEGAQVFWMEAGDPSADPIVFFHGIPTWSFLWRGVIPHLVDHGRVIVFDQLGQGLSSKSDSLTYTYKQQLAFVEAFFEEAGLDGQNLTIVAHDTGGSLGFAYAARHPETIKGLAFFETVLGPVPSFDVMPLQAQQFRSDAGNAAIISDNTFIKNLIVNGHETAPPNDRPFLVSPLSRTAVLAYSFPYARKKNRRVLAQWVREIPIIGGAPDGHGDTNLELWGQFGGYLAMSDTPKLLLHASPGVLTTPPTVGFLEANYNALTSVDLGEVGYHFLQEDFPAKVGGEIATWYASLP